MLQIGLWWRDFVVLSLQNEVRSEFGREGEDVNSGSCKEEGIEAEGFGVGMC